MNLVEYQYETLAGAQRLLKFAQENLRIKENEVLLNMPEKQLVDYIKNQFVQVMIYIAAVKHDIYYIYFECDRSENHITVEMLDSVAPGWGYIIDAVSARSNNAEDCYSLYKHIGADRSVALIDYEAEYLDDWNYDWNYGWNYYVVGDRKFFAKRLEEAFNNNKEEILQFFILEENLDIDDIIPASQMKQKTDFVKYLLKFKFKED